MIKRNQLYRLLVGCLVLGLLLVACERPLQEDTPSTPSNVEQDVTGVVSDTAEDVADAVDDTADAVGDTVGDAVDAVGDTVSDAVDATGDAANDAVDAVADTVDDVADAVTDSSDGATDSTTDTDGASSDTGEEGSTDESPRSDGDGDTTTTDSDSDAGITDDTSSDGATDAGTDADASSDADTTDDTSSDGATDADATTDGDAGTDADASSDADSSTDTSDVDSSTDADTSITPTSSEAQVHTVAAGETLYQIGLQYGMSWVTIRDYNNLHNANRIYAGQTINIPPADGGTDDSTTEGSEDAGTAEQNYVIQRGDTLFKIGQAFGVNWVQIAEANGLVNPNLLYPGQTLKIPASADGPSPQFTHVVQRGDTLYRLSIRYGVPWQEIAAANNINPPYIIYPGTTLTIEGGQ